MGRPTPQFGSGSVWISTEKLRRILVLGIGFLCLGGHYSNGIQSFHAPVRPTSVESHELLSPSGFQTIRETHNSIDREDRTLPKVFPLYRVDSRIERVTSASVGGQTGTHVGSRNFPLVRVETDIRYGFLDGQNIGGIVDRRELEANLKRLLSPTST